MEQRLGFLQVRGGDADDVQNRDHFGERAGDTVDCREFADTEAAQEGEEEELSEASGNVRSQYNPDTVLLHAPVSIGGVCGIELVTGRGNVSQ